jgi:hypothetical protein
MTILRTAVCVALLMASLAGQSEYKSWQLRHAPDDLRPAISRADLVIVAMQNEVLRELNHALARDGAPASLAFCHVDVEGVIRRISREDGVVAGRTSDRLRNPANAPRAWAAPLVAAHAGWPAKRVDGYAVDLGDRVGVLRPIVEQPMCGGCHGTSDRLAPGLTLVLKRRYPSDRATGFRDGEIRGWFWVEMPRRLQHGS